MKISVLTPSGMHVASITYVIYKHVFIVCYLHVRFIFTILYFALRQKDLGLHVFSVPDMILFVFIEIMIIMMLVILKVLLHKVNPVATISVKQVKNFVLKIMK